jgi:hypothetical protein
VLPAVDEDHRDPVGVLRPPGRVGVHVELVVAESELARQPAQQHLGLLAQMAAGPGDEGDAMVRGRHGTSLRTPDMSRIIVFAEAI